MPCEGQTKRKVYLENKKSYSSNIFYHMQLVFIKLKIHANTFVDTL